MPRFKLTLEYDGTPFSGWQRQTGVATVQESLEEAFADLLGEPATVWGSGRTDAGVHARGQVAHVDIAKPYKAFAIQGAINKRLRHVPISLLNVEEVSPDFHARFSATARIYEYIILNRRAPSALERTRAWWVIHPLSIEAMAEAATHLIGHHDFSSFRDSHCQASSPLKTLDVLSVEKSEGVVLIKARARSFLHHQVRNMVGTLKRVGEGVWTPEKVKEILEAKDRRCGGPTAPAEGLYLTEICY
ncbi:MAG: tRNA pseudouridine(38-40) synthase TruA [Alphaproteobacteria bacterium 41-28]|nr:MAG: tRNA pseudouridine(38-40) synthase TruA [Alphaproteobacteria bacterium 41-28]